MGNDDFDFMDEDLDNEDREERRGNYNRTYLSEIERQTKGIEDELEREELFSELEKRHNVVRSGNPIADAEHNILAAKSALHEYGEKRDPALKNLMDSIDRDRGEKGHAKKLLKEAYAKDSAFFDPELNPNVRRLR